VDNLTSVDHKIPNCFSNEVYKGILDGKSHAVFNGKIFVRPNAQQTNAFQSNKNVSLSDDTTINTKPQLEIWADDVKCSHGCTIGQLDKEALFYLRARGLDEKAAKSLILIAFAEDTFEHIPFDFVKEELHHLITSRLS
jgi:Fe-S cluster assembly protein SufD